MDELHDLAKNFADCIVPQEYGVDKEEKRILGSHMCQALLEKIKYDLIIARGNENFDVRYNLVRLFLFLLLSSSLSSSSSIHSKQKKSLLSTRPPTHPPTGRSPRRRSSHQLARPPRPHPPLFHQ